nr:YdeI/OmpD-associated family protein [Stagnihabitans tardus]
MAAARDILLAQGLAETLKWGQPCYVEGGNIALLGGFKSGLRMIFPKGALIEEAALISPGENTRSGRYLSFASAEEVEAQAPLIRRVVAQARRLEAEGVRVDFAADPEPDWPEELTAFCEEDPDYTAAFQALTPGRRRFWILHFSEAKQVKTRLARVARSRERVLAGKGLND